MPRRRSRRSTGAGLLIVVVAALGLAACGASYTAPTFSSLTTAGQHEQARHDAAAATTSYRAALAIDPSYVPALLGLSELSEVRVVAVALAQQAVTLAPNDPAAHTVLGHELISLGETTPGHEQLAIAARLRRLHGRSGS